jgi:hypothetical protein
LGNVAATARSEPLRVIHITPNFTPCQEPWSFTAFIGHPAYNTDTLRADLHRFVFLLGASDGEDLFGEPAP